MQHEFYRQIFAKSSTLNFVKIYPVGGELLHADRQTDKTKLIIAFRNFANAPKACHRDSRKGHTCPDSSNTGKGHTCPDSSNTGILLTFQVNVSLTLLQFNIYNALKMGKKNTGWDLNKKHIFHSRQDAVATKCFTVAPNICESSVWNVLHVTLLAPTVLRWLQNCGKCWHCSLELCFFY
jgi:hypothetical protein